MYTSHDLSALTASTLFVGLTLSIPAAAITNIESERLDDNRAGLQGHIELSVDGKSGNSDKQTIEFGSKLSYQQVRQTWLIIADKEYGESADVKNTDNSFLHGRYIRQLTPSWAFETYLQFQEDEFRLLDFRGLFGIGGRYQFFPQHPKQRLAIGIGAYYTREKYATEPTELEETYTRASAYVAYQQKLNDTLQLTNTLYWQPRLSDISDQYGYNQLSITVKLSDQLGLKVGLESSFDSDPVGDVEKADHSYKTSLAYRF